MKYTKLEGLVLKKQNYKEADQIVTLWTKEAGKVRVMARGLKLAKSKLAFSMQDLAVVEIETAGNKTLPALIAAKPIKNFLAMRSDLNKNMASFYGAELLLKTTADEQANIEAYNLTLAYLNFINSDDSLPMHIFSLVDNYALQLLRSLGFSIEHAAGIVDIPASLESYITQLLNTEPQNLPQITVEPSIIVKTHQVVKNFIEYVLERNLKSDKFLMSV